MRTQIVPETRAESPILGHRMARRALEKALEARPVSTFEAPELFQHVERLRRAARLPAPQLSITPHQQANTFAWGAGPGDAVLAVSRGALETLTDDELEGLLAYQLVRIGSRDLSLVTWSGGLATLLGRSAGLGIVPPGDHDPFPLASPGSALVAPVGAFLVRFGHGADVVVTADHAAVRLTGKPAALARALERAEYSAHVAPLGAVAGIAPVAAVDPFGASRPTSLARLFKTHPVTASRATLLRRMADPESSGNRMRPAA